MRAVAAYRRAMIATGWGVHNRRGFCVRLCTIRLGDL